jgi:hypothetical protein
VQTISTKDSALIVINTTSSVRAEFRVKVNDGDVRMTHGELSLERNEVWEVF